MVQVTVLDVAFTVEGMFQTIEDCIHPVVLQDGKNTVLVDCGVVGGRQALEEALAAKGIPPYTLTHIFITHHDHDHVGALAAMKQKYPQVQIVASAEEMPFIEQSEKSPRLQQVEEMQATLPPEHQAFG